MFSSKRKKWEAEGERIRNYWQQKMEVLEVCSNEAPKTDSGDLRNHGCRPTDPPGGDQLDPFPGKNKVSAL